MESRLLKQEEKIYVTQKNIIKDQERVLSLQNILMGTNKSINRGQGAIYNGIANIYHYLREANTYDSSDYLCQEISWYLADFDMMLTIYSPMKLRKILKKIQNCINTNISLNKRQIDILVDQIDHTFEKFKKTPESSDPELRKIINEAISLIHSISA